MGLFDRFSTAHEPAQWNPSNGIEAWAACLYALAMNDGVMSEAEFDTWSFALLSTEQFRLVDLAPLIHAVQGEGAKRPWEVLCVEWARQVEKEHAPTVFAMACEIAMRDGNLQRSETELLQSVASALPIEMSFAEQVVEASMARWKFQVRLG